MAKISSYPDGGVIQATDKFVIARAGANFSILGDKVVSIRSITVLTSGAANFVPAATTKYMEVEMIGAGGGGGGADGDAATSGCGGGGGSGAYLKKLYTTIAALYAYSVGALGAGGAAGNNAGIAGGNTTFGALTAPGGNGGASMANGNTLAMAAGGTGGAIATGGDFNITGTTGSNGIRLDGATAWGGDGAPSLLGARGPAARSATSAVGVAAGGYGAGGGGARANSATDRAGGNGSGGVIIIREYS